MCTDHDLDLSMFVPVDHDLDLSVQIMIWTCMCVYRSQFGLVLSTCVLSSQIHFAVGDFHWGRLETRSVVAIFLGGVLIPVAWCLHEMYLTVFEGFHRY